MRPPGETAGANDLSKGRSFLLDGECDLRSWASRSRCGIGPRSSLLHLQLNLIQKDEIPPAWGAFCMRVISAMHTARNDARPGIVGVMWRARPEAMLHTNSTNLRVIVTSLPGTWQRILVNNVESHCSVDVVAVAHGSLMTVQLAREHQPDVLLIDSSIPADEAIVLVQNLKPKHPETALVVITNSSHQRHLFAQAGADYVLPAYSFETRIHDILNELSKACLQSQDSTEDSTEKVSD